MIEATIKTFVYLLKDQIINNVYVNTDTSFGEVSELPAIIITKLTLMDNIEKNYPGLINKKEIYDGTEEIPIVVDYENAVEKDDKYIIEQYKHPTTVLNILFEIVILTDREASLLSLNRKIIIVSNRYQVMEIIDAQGIKHNIEIYFDRDRGDHKWIPDNSNLKHVVLTGRLDGVFIFDDEEIEILHMILKRTVKWTDMKGRVLDDPSF